MMEDLSFFESAEDAIRYKQDCIEMELLHHRNLCDIDTVSQLCWMEDGDSKAESDGLMTKIGNGLQALMDKILSIVKAVINGIKSGQGNHLVFDEWIESDDAEYQMNTDIEKMVATLDEQYLQMRTTVQKISSATGMDPKKVAEIADRAGLAAEKAANFSHSQTAKEIMKGAAVKKLGRHLGQKMYDTDGLIKENQQKVKSLKKDAKFKDRVTCYEHAMHALSKITLGYKKATDSLKAVVKKTKRTDT